MRLNFWALNYTYTVSLRIQTKHSFCSNHVLARQVEMLVYKSRQIFQRSAIIIKVYKSKKIFQKSPKIKTNGIPNYVSLNTIFSFHKYQC